MSTPGAPAFPHGVQASGAGAVASEAAVSGVCENPAASTPAAPASTPAAPAAKSCTVSLPGADLTGADIPDASHLAAADAEECAGLCQAHPECQFFTFAWEHCYLKTGDAGKHAQPAADSGSCITGAAAPPPVEGGGTANPAEAPVYEFKGLNKDGVGCCRAKGGKRALGEYTLFPDVVDMGACKALCLGDAACKGIELSADGCEVHTATLSRATKNKGVCCARTIAHLPRSGLPTSRLVRVCVCVCVCVWCQRKKVRVCQVGFV